MFFPEYAHTRSIRSVVIHFFLQAAHLPRDFHARRTRRPTLITHIKYYNIYHNKVVITFK